MDNSIITKVEEHIFQYYRDNASSNNTFHNIVHVKNVVDFVKEIGENSQLTESDLEILIIATWFHGIGYLESIIDHEKISSSYSKKFLLQHNYPLSKVEKVTRCIMATKMPHHPQNNIEEVLCDADIAHIGTKDFFNNSLS